MITQITLKNYRNITDFDSTLKKINLIVAPNGAGKTNLLESIFFLFNGTSFKSMRSMLDAVGPNEDFSTVKIILQKNICEMVIIKSPNLKKQYKKNNKKTNLKQIYKILKPVIFSPNSVDLVDGAPEVRRKDLDLFIASFDYQYSDALTRYEKVLKNKNAILKNIRDGNSTIEQLEFWNNELCKTAEILVSKRISIIEKINNQLLNSSKYFSPDSKISIDYQHFRPIDLNSYAQNLLQLFLKNTQKEIIVGKTLYGPHKDTIDIYKNDKALRFFGSRGEQRIGAFCLKLAQLELLQNENLNVVFLLDDIFSELDESHRKIVSEIILSRSERIQTFITTSTIDEIPEKLLKTSYLISIKDSNS